MSRLVPVSIDSTPTVVERAVRDIVTGIGPRPRLEYTVRGQRRIAIGRRGESADRLRAELVATYGLVHTAVVRQQNDALAEYVAHGGNYRRYARALKASHRTFLRSAKEPGEVERAVVLSDRHFERVWRLGQEYEVPQGEGDVSLDVCGEWAKHEAPAELAGVGPLEPELEPARELPMAIPKADGRGKNCMYFGFALNIGGRCRWSQMDFEPPLQIPLGGLLNRELGFGGSTQADEVVPFRGDCFPWGRNQRLGKRIIDPWERGPVCRTLEHPEPR